MTVPRRSILVDTSALYAVLDRADDHHAAAAEGWHRLLDGFERDDLTLLTHSGVVVEVSALVQRRLGMEALRTLHDAILGLFEICWVDQVLHDRAVTALLAADRRGVSLVDWTSFELMRMRALSTAFAFDDDFARQGFEPFA